MARGQRGRSLGERRVLIVLDHGDGCAIAVGALRDGGALRAGSTGGREEREREQHAGNRGRSSHAFFPHWPLAFSAMPKKAQVSTTNRSATLSSALGHGGSPTTRKSPRSCPLTLTLTPGNHQV